VTKLPTLLNYSLTILCSKLQVATKKNDQGH
jgi:hypothetical protein